MYISAWKIHTDGLVIVLRDAVEAGRVSENDIVWCGPSGDAVIASSPASLAEDYADYVDSGTIREYIIE